MTRKSHLAKDQLTVTQVARKFKVEPKLIKRLCDKGEIKARHRGVNQDGPYLIQKDELQRIRLHPSISGKRICQICEKFFRYTKGQGSRKVCTRVRCQKEYHRRKNEACFRQKITLKSLRSWHKDVWLKLRGRPLAKKEKWILPEEVRRRTGLTYSQVRFLRRRKLVAIYRDTARLMKRVGAPVAMYAASEVEIIRRILAKYQRGKKKQ